MFKFLSSYSCCRHGPHFRALPLLCLSSSSVPAAAAAPAAASPALCSPSPPETHHFVVDYLVDKLGFTSEKAIRASKYLSSLKSLDKPQFVIAFMETHGFSHAQIQKIVSSHPKCLRLNVEKTLAPKFKSLNDIGFSGSDLTDLVNSNPRVIHLNFSRKILPKIEFWQTLLGSKDRLIRLLKQNNNFITRNIEKTVLPTISFLRSCGVSDEKITMAARHCPRFIIQRRQNLISIAEQVETEIGIARGSGMFIWALLSLSKISKVRLKANIETMKEFGWSEADFLSASARAPCFLTLSKKMLAKKMDFLLKETECQPSYVAQYPLLLMLSLEKRLIPRHKVMKILRSRGLLTKERMLSTVMAYSEKVFMDKFVAPHKHEAPELQDIYRDGWRE